MVSFCVCDKVGFGQLVDGWWLVSRDWWSVVGVPWLVLNVSCLEVSVSLVSCILSKRKALSSFLARELWTCCLSSSWSDASR